MSALFYRKEIDSCPYSFFFQYIQDNGFFTSSIEECDFFLLPFEYELIVGSQEESKNCYNVTPANYLLLKSAANELNQLSVSSNKKLVVFLYNDYDGPLPFSNAIVFRTSWKRSLNSKNVFAMPAFVEGLAQNAEKIILKKQILPSISFRGQSVPLKLGWKTKLRDFINGCLRLLGSRYRLNVFYPHNYMVRGKAIRSLLKAKAQLSFDLALQTHNGAHNHPDKRGYLESFRKNPYVLCVAGWGNYSYRFYETLREGRIPVFIDTDCQLPCSDEIDWHKHLLYINEQKARKTAHRLRKFHQTISPQHFAELQVANLALYKNYFTQEGFARYVYRFLAAGQF